MLFFAAGCFAQDVLTSWSSTISVSPSARGFCINELTLRSSALSTTKFFFAAGCFAQDVLTSWNSTISVSPSARGFCINEAYSLFLGDGTTALVALPFTENHLALCYEFSLDGPYGGVKNIPFCLV